MKDLFLNNSRVLILNLTFIHIQAATFKLGVLVLMTKELYFAGDIFSFHKFKVTDIESVNNILKFLLSNTYFKYVLSPGLHFVRFWEDDFWAYKK